MTSPSSPRSRRMHVSCFDGEAFEAEVLLDRDGEPHRWNGWIAYPMFRREVAEKIVEKVNAHPLDVESDRFVWVGDKLLRFCWDGVNRGGDPVEDLFMREVILPDPNGLYAIGVMSWVWSEVTEAELRALDGNR